MRWLYIVASCWLLAVAGCASSGVVKNATPVLTSAPVSLDFVLVETSGSTTNLEAAEQLLKDKLVIGLRETRVFGSVTGNKADVGSGSGMKIQAQIKEVKTVSPNARAWFGGLAGHARVLVQVTVSDLNSGNQIQAFEIEAESGASAMAGTTDQTVQQAAQQIVAEIVRISRQTSQ
ncbi:MAG: hypothetical protein WDN00_07790 [Limisphaerales bacterium]